MNLGAHQYHGKCGGALSAVNPKADEDAISGSFMLREACHHLFRKAENHFGLAEGDGVYLLLDNGRRPG
jgi:hypothetical protein